MGPVPSITVLVKSCAINALALPDCKVKLTVVTEVDEVGGMGKALANVYLPH